MVNRGVRWQRYCYFCREFWSNRVAATEPPLQASETRVPEVPDQKLFVDAWFDYHRGFRIETGSDGNETKIELLREKPWREVDPGHLPVLNEREKRMALRAARTVLPEAIVHTSLDQTLDDLLDEADEEASGASPEVAQDNDAELEERRRAADEKAVQDALQRLDQADRQQGSAILRKQRAACELQAAERSLQTLQTARRTAHREHQQAQELYKLLHEQNDARLRAAQRFARVFGTREDIERQGSEYVSPLTSMFTRAYDRYRTAEEVRAQERESAQNSIRHREFLTDLAQQQYPALFYAIQTEVEGQALEPGPIRTLDDANDDRPPPKNDDELTVKLECKVCLQQIADTACLPCGHLVLCVHCADIVIPTRDNDHTAPLKKSNCPLCRKGVTRRVRVFTS